MAQEKIQTTEQDFIQVLWTENQQWNFRKMAAKLLPNHKPSTATKEQMKISSSVKFWWSIKQMEKKKTRYLTVPWPGAVAFGPSLQTENRQNI